MPTRGYMSPSELPVTFGLGSATRIDDIEVVWHSGQRQRVAPSAVRLNALNVLRESAP